METDAEMNALRAAALEDSSSSRQPSRMTLIWYGLLFAWFVVLCLVPDPRPLGASEVAVKAVRLLLGVSDPIARVFCYNCSSRHGSNGDWRPARAVVWTSPTQGCRS